MIAIPQFRRHLEVEGIVTDGQHSVFSQGLHGQKVDFDLIRPGSALDDEWTDLNVHALRQNHHYNMPRYIMSIAGGTIRLVDNMDREMNGEVRSLHTVKDPDDNMPKLSDKANAVLRDKKLRVREIRVALIEDVSSTGAKAAFVAEQVLDINPDIKLEMQTTFQRQETLPRLDALDIPYNAIIKDILPTYTEAECRAIGFCAMGEEPIPYGI